MNPVGDFAKADMRVMLLAQELNGHVMDYINDAYFAEEPLNLENLTYDRFMKAYEKAHDAGPEAIDELNQQLAGILAPIFDQFMQMPPQEMA